jgi:hypothetical protein
MRSAVAKYSETKFGFPTGGSCPANETEEYRIIKTLRTEASVFMSLGSGISRGHAAISGYNFDERISSKL